MRLGGRLSAAIDIVTTIDKTRRPAAECLKEWGVAHRFAGSGDRAAIGNLVHDMLRKKQSFAYIMDDDSPRALGLAVLRFEWGQKLIKLQGLFADDKFAPQALTDKEQQLLADNVKPGQILSRAPIHVQGDIPQWLLPSFRLAFDDEAALEGRALAQRPPIDVRINTQKSTRKKMLKALSRFNPEPSPISPIGLRFAPRKAQARSPNLQADEAYQKGRIEIQDEASQIASQLVFAQHGEKILDFCAGSGGKSLALAALMGGSGQVYAHDADVNRLAPIYERIKRAGVHNIQVCAPHQNQLDCLVNTMDRVVVDAPCSGTGIWRRRPDTKWRLSPKTLETRITEQEEILSQACSYVRPGGFYIYMTCSILGEENEVQIERFLSENSQFHLVCAGEVWQDLFGFDKPKPWSSDLRSITLTPASTQTDGFFFAVMQRAR